MHRDRRLWDWPHPSAPGIFRRAMDRMRRAVAAVPDPARWSSSALSARDVMLATFWQSLPGSNQLR
jgi:hypothetical protein